MDELVRTIAEALAERWTRPTEENPEWRRQYRKNPDTTEPEFLDVPMDERIERSCSTVERAGDGYPSIRPLAFVEVAEVAAVGEDALLIHDERKDNPGLAFQLSRLSRGPYEPTPIGVFRDVELPEYGQQMAEQIDTATERRGQGDFAALLRSGSSWNVE